MLENQLLAPASMAVQSLGRMAFFLLDVIFIYVYCEILALFPLLYRIPLQHVYFKHSSLYLSPTPEIGHPKFSVSVSLVLLLYSLVCCIVYILYI